MIIRGEVNCQHNVGNNNYDAKGVENNPGMIGQFQVMQHMMLKFIQH